MFRFCSALLLVAFAFLSWKHGEDSGGFALASLDVARSKGGQLALIATAAQALAALRLARRPVGAVLAMTIYIHGAIYALAAWAIGAAAAPDRALHTLFMAALSFAAVWLCAMRARRVAP